MEGEEVVAEEEEEEMEELEALVVLEALDQLDLMVTAPGMDLEVVMEMAMGEEMEGEEVVAEEEEEGMERLVG